MPKKEAAAADAAIAEVVAETETDALVPVEFNGETYELRRGRLGSVEFRLAMRDAMPTPEFLDVTSLLVALRVLFGPKEWARLVAANTGPDGMPSELAIDLANAVGKATGSGKS
jgi:hypothetical protein